MRPLRIAAHNGAPEWGGAEIAVSRLLADLQSRGHCVTFWCARPLVAKRAAEFGLDTAPLHVGGDIALHHALRVARALRRWRADVLIVGTFRKLLHLTLGARLAGVPVVARIGLGSDLPRNAKYRMLVSRHVARVVVNSHELREAWLRALPGLDPMRVDVVYKGVTPPADVPSRAEARRQLGLGIDDRVIGGVGRMVSQKRFDRWLDVLAGLPHDVKGLLVGDGPLRPELHARAARLGIADRIRFTGFVPAAWPALPALDLLLMTSAKESMANVMLEAMALGVPTVSTPVDGAREALATDDDAGVGLVTRDFEVDSLRAAITELLADSVRLTAMKERARERAARVFTPERSVTEWERILDQVARRD